MSLIFKKNNEKIWQISAQESEKWWNQQNKDTKDNYIIVYIKVYGLFNLSVYYKKVPLSCWFDHFLDFSAEIHQNFVGFS